MRKMWVGILTKAYANCEADVREGAPGAVSSVHGVGPTGKGSPDVLHSIRGMIPHRDYTKMAVDVELHT